MRLWIDYNDTSELESTFIDCVKLAGQIIDARVARFDRNRAGMILCWAAKVFIEGGDDRSYEEAERNLCRYFDSSVMKIVHAIVADIGKVVMDYEETEDREELRKVGQFIDAHGSGDIANGLDAICAALAVCE